MAIAGIDSYDNSTSLHKDIKDKLAYVQTVDCPMYDAGKAMTAKGTIHYFNEVVYTAPSAENARAEGATLTDDTPPTESQYTTYTEINSEGWTVSTSMQSSAKNGNVIGTNDEIARMKMEALEKLKMQCEWSIINGTTNAGDNTPTARRMTGIIAWANNGTTANTALSTLGDASAGETNWKAFLIALRAAGGLRSKRKVALMSWTNKQTLSGWSGIVDSVDTMAGEKTIYTTVDIYDSMYGKIMFKGHDLMPSTSIIVLDPEYLRLPYLTKTEKRKLGTTKLGDAYHWYNELCVTYDKPATLGRFNATS